MKPCPAGRVTNVQRFSSPPRKTHLLIQVKTRLERGRTLDESFD